MPFVYYRTIRFQDTDAAGVVYFAQILSICHEAYEESLRQGGIDVRAFFSQGAIAVPLTHAEADFRRPLMCGDAVTVWLTATQTRDDRFELHYEVQHDGKTAAIAHTHHVCIATATRQRHPLPPALTQWLPTIAAPPTAAGSPD